MIWAFLLKHIADLKLWAGAGLCLIAAVAGLQTARLAHAKADLATARAALVDPATRKAWRAEAVADAAALDAEDQAVAALKAAGRADTQRAAAAVAAAQGRLDAASAAAAKLLATPPGADGCASADALILESLGGPH
jgi:hypothetical protein